MDVSVIILNYNNAKDCIQAVGTLRTHTFGVSYEILLVDNCSPDDSVAVLREALPDVRLICGERNGGFAYGNNLGIAQACGDFVLMMNPDILLNSDALTEVSQYLRVHGGMAGVRQITGNGQLDWACKRGLPTPWNAFCRFTHLDRLFPTWPKVNGYNLRHLDPEGVFEVDALSGAFMMITREALQAVGGFDEEHYFMYGEDIDLCHCVKQAGFPVHYLGNIWVRHLRGTTTSKESTRMIVAFHESMRVFYKKHLWKTYGPVAGGFVLFAIGLRQQMSLLRNAFRKEKRVT